MTRPTRAARALRAVCDEKTQTVVAREISRRLRRRIQQASVSEWVLGKCRPRPDVMRILEVLYDIEIAWWYEVASKSAA